MMESIWLDDVTRAESIDELCWGSVHNKLGTSFRPTQSTSGHVSAEAEIFVLEVHDGDGDVVSEHPHHVLGGVVQGAEAGVHKIAINASMANGQIALGQTKVKEFRKSVFKENKRQLENGWAIILSNYPMVEHYISK